MAARSILLTSFGVASAAPLQCGVASNVFSSNPQTLDTALSTGKLSFWWNWGQLTNLDEKALSPASVAAAKASFVPMMWGQGFPSDVSFLQDTDAVMGYNEPDLYGPACCNCDGLQSYYPATSSGWLPLHDPVLAVGQWVATVSNLTTQTGNLKRITTPCMAGDVKPDAGNDCSQDPSNPGAQKMCNGWLSMFKDNALKANCQGFGGKQMNCWDVTSVIVIHSYAHAYQDVLNKIDQYQAVFADDFAGTNGRTKKTLWLTEVAAATSDGTAATAFVEGLMSTSGGLGDRTKYDFVERVSWFSEFTFPAFNISGIIPAPNEAWTSTLFNPFGGLSPIGDAFFKNCASA